MTLVPSSCLPLNVARWTAAVPSALASFGDQLIPNLTASFRSEVSVRMNQIRSSSDLPISSPCVPLYKGKVTVWRTWSTLMALASRLGMLSDDRTGGQFRAAGLASAALPVAKDRHATNAGRID